MLEGRPTWSSAALLDRRSLRRRRRAASRGSRPRRLPATEPGRRPRRPAAPVSRRSPRRAAVTPRGDARASRAAAGRPPRPAGRHARRRSIRPATRRSSSSRAASARRTTAPSARARPRSTARTGGRTRDRSSSCTATSARAASSSTTSRSAATTTSTRLAEPLAAAARQQLHADRTARRARSSSAATTGQQRRARTRRRRRANMRLRLNPEIHISRQPARPVADRSPRQPRARLDARRATRIKPERPRIERLPGHGRNGYNGYAPLGAFSTTQGPPTAGVNGYRNSIDVQARVGRVPHAARSAPLRPHAQPLGPRHARRTPATASTQDYQSNADRIMFVVGHQVDRPLLRRRVGLRLDGSDERVALRRLRRSAVQHGEPHEREPVGARSRRGARTPSSSGSSSRATTLVVNGGLYTVYRSQFLDVKAGADSADAPTRRRARTNNGFERRGA